MSGDALEQVLLDLAGLLRPGDGSVPARITEGLAEDELDRPGSAPAWLVDLLARVRDRHPDGWIDFHRPMTDDTNVFDFVRGLPDLLPVTYVNNEESVLLVFPALGLEAAISIEGSCYKVSPTGRTWDD